MIPRERLSRLFREGLHQLLRAPEAASTPGFCRESSGEGLANAAAASDSASHSHDQLFAALRVGETKTLVKQIPGPQRATISKDVRPTEMIRLKVTAQKGLVSAKDGLDIVLHVEEEILLEQALQVDIEASVDMPTGKTQDISSPPTTQGEVRRSKFRKVFDPS